MSENIESRLKELAEELKEKYNKSDFSEFNKEGVIEKIKDLSTKWRDLKEEEIIEESQKIKERIKISYSSHIGEKLANKMEQIKKLIKKIKANYNPDEDIYNIWKKVYEEVKKDKKDEEDFQRLGIANISAWFSLFFPDNFIPANKNILGGLIEDKLINEFWGGKPDIDFSIKFYRSLNKIRQEMNLNTMHEIGYYFSRYSNEKNAGTSGKGGGEKEKTAPENKPKVVDKLDTIMRTVETKPFLILAGVSGTGKTQIARIIASMITCRSKSSRESSQIIEILQSIYKEKQEKILNYREYIENFKSAIQKKNKDEIQEILEKLSPESVIKNHIKDINDDKLYEFLEIVQKSDGDINEVKKIYKEVFNRNDEKPSRIGPSILTLLLSLIFPKKYSPYFGEYNNKIISKLIPDLKIKIPSRLDDVDKFSNNYSRYIDTCVQIKEKLGLEYVFDLNAIFIEYLEVNKQKEGKDE